MECPPHKPLDVYLKELAACPEDSLGDEFGIYDNHQILLALPHPKIKQHLASTKKFRYNRKLDSTRDSYYFIPGTVELVAYNEFPGGFVTGMGEGTNADEQLHGEFQRQTFNTCFALQWYQQKQIPNVSRVKAISLAVEVICNYAIKERIPLCIPKSLGWNHRGDYARIAYHLP